MTSKDLSLRTPVALFGYNRPGYTRQLVDIVKGLNPSEVYVICDGAKTPAETGIVSQTQAALTSFPDTVKVETHFSTTNLGCKRRLSSGLDWLFSRVGEAIILEDDCHPHPSFFNYCSTLLDRFRADPRVMMVAGSNFQAGRQYGHSSYYFSKYTPIWGWATWADRWKLYDAEMKEWPTVRESDHFRNWCSDEREHTLWKEIFDATYRGDVDTWDYQWTFAAMSQNRLSAICQSNLIANVGCHPIAALTPYGKRVANLPTRPIESIVHPEDVAQNKSADTAFCNEVLLRSHARPQSFSTALRALATRVRNRIAKDVNS